MHLFRKLNLEKFNSDVNIFNIFSFNSVPLQQLNKICVILRNVKKKIKLLLTNVSYNII